MPICKSDIIIIRKEETVFWMLKSSQYFHLVLVDSGMTDDKKEKLMQIYPCDSAKISRLGISCSEIKKDKLNNVETDGYSKGDTLVLCVSGKKRRYTLEEDCDRDGFHSFFECITINETPQTDHSKKQTSPAKSLAMAMNVASVVVAAGCFLNLQPQKMWFWLCIVWQFVPIAFAVVFRSDFRFAQYKRNRDNKGKADLSIACAAPSFAMFICINRDYTFLDSAHVLIVVAVSIAVAALLFTLYMRILGNGESRFKSTAEVIVTIAVIIFSTVMQVNCYLDRNPVDRYTAQVTDMYTKGTTKHRFSYCTVVMPDGELQELKISKKKYYNIDVGDSVVVAHHKGALGMPFYFVEVNE